MTEIWSSGAPFRRNVMGVLDVTLVHVAVCRSEGFREGVGSQNVEAAREPMLKGGLQSVVEHA